MIIGALGILEQCGRAKEDDDTTTDSRIPASWDGKTDYSASSFKLETKNQ